MRNLVTSPSVRYTGTMSVIALSMIFSLKCIPKKYRLLTSTEASDSVTVLLSNERGGYTPAAGSPYTTGRNPRIVLGDVNRDGKPDIITANNGSSNTTVLLGK